MCLHHFARIGDLNFDFQEARVFVRLLFDDRCWYGWLRQLALLYSEWLMNVQLEKRIVIFKHVKVWLI